MRDINMGSIRSVDRAIDVLQAFTREKPHLTSDEISKITNIPHSTVYRLLCTLERKGLVQFNEKTLTYKPGLRLMEFGYIAGSVLDVRKEAEDILSDLHTKINQTVLMAVEEGDYIFYIYNKENYQGLKYSSVVGERKPYIYGVLGPVLLAFLPEKEIERLINLPITLHTKYTITDKNVIRKRLENIRRDHLYVETNETTVGVTGIGAPVFGPNGDIIAAIGVVGPSVQLDPELENGKVLVTEASRKISHKMGYR